MNRTNGCQPQDSQTTAQTKKDNKIKRKKTPPVTYKAVEKDIDRLARCFERKRLERVAKIPQEVEECIHVKKCCKPRDSLKEYYDKFEQELEEDRQMRKKIQVGSACSGRQPKKVADQKPANDEMDCCTNGEPVCPCMKNKASSCSDF